MLISEIRKLRRTENPAPYRTANGSGAMEQCLRSLEGGGAAGSRRVAQSRRGAGAWNNIGRGGTQGLLAMLLWNPGRKVVPLSWGSDSWDRLGEGGGGPGVF